MDISCLLESLLLFSLSLWSVPFAFLYYHFSGIPGGSGDNVCVHGACTGKRGQESRQPGWDVWEPGAVRQIRIHPAGQSSLTSIDQSGLAQRRARQRLPKHRWNTWILCHLHLGVGIHFVYSTCMYWPFLQASTGQLTPESPLLTPLICSISREIWEATLPVTLSLFWDVTVASFLELLWDHWPEPLCPAYVNRGLILKPMWGAGWDY